VIRPQHHCCNPPFQVSKELWCLARLRYSRLSLPATIPLRTTLPTYAGAGPSPCSKRRDTTERWKDSEPRRGSLRAESPRRFRELGLQCCISISGRLSPQAAGSANPPAGESHSITGDRRFFRRGLVICCPCSGGYERVPRDCRRGPASPAASPLAIAADDGALYFPRLQSTAQDPSERSGPRYARSWINTNRWN